MRTCVDASMSETLRRARRHRRVHCRRCVERRRQTTRRPSAGPSAAARAGGRALSRARARPSSARARRRGRAHPPEPPRRLHDPSPRAAPASSSADGGWLCLLAKLGNGGQPRRALLRRGRGATGESLAQANACRRAPRAAFGGANTTCVRVMCLQFVEGAGGQGGKEASGEVLGDTFRYAWWRLVLVRVLQSTRRQILAFCPPLICYRWVWNQQRTF